MQTKIKSAFPWLCWDKEYTSWSSLEKRYFFAVCYVCLDLFPHSWKRIRYNQSLPSAYLYYFTNERPLALWKISILLGGHLLNFYGPLTCALKCSSMPGPQTSSPSSVECCFCRWTNSNPFCVVEKWLYRSSYILTTTLSQILSDIESWAQSSLKLQSHSFCGWKKKPSPN